MYPLRLRVAKGANLTVVVRRSEGENGALLGSGLGPWMEAVILREDEDGIRLEEFRGCPGISRYAEPEAEGMMPV